MSNQTAEIGFKNLASPTTQQWMTFGHHRSEVEQALAILGSRERNCVVIVAEPGLETDSVINGVAEAIAQGMARRDLARANIYEFSRARRASQDTADPAEVWIEKIASSGDLLYLPPSSRVLAGVDPDDSAGALIRRRIADGLRVITVMTEDAYREHLANGSLNRRFAPVRLAPVRRAGALNLMKAVRDEYEGHHGIAISDAALIAAVALADHHVDDRDLFAASQTLLDRACARVESLSAALSPRVSELDRNIAEARTAKEQASENQEFDRAATLRDVEKKLLVDRQLELRRWLSDSHSHTLSASEVVDAAAEHTGIDARRLRATLSGPTSDQTAPPQAPARYRLLNDQPATRTTDLLGTTETAKSLAEILVESWSSSPFVLAIDGGWGAGKSTLLRLIASHLPKALERGARDKTVVAVEFNAWMAGGQDALPSLIKRVLLELDPKQVRRSLRKLLRSTHASTISRLFLSAAAQFVGARKLVDEMWERAGTDAALRDQVRNTIDSMIRDWAGVDPAGGPARTLVVFVDDLDRCTDSAVVGVCEAMKLYLNSPGIVFVVACDMERVASSLGGEEAATAIGLAYLEKIIQIVHRLAPPDLHGIERLAAGYAEASRTSGLVDSLVIQILVEQTDHNPRRIKRIINSFVLESYLSPEWSSAPLSPTHLLVATLLQHLYPDFYSALADAPDEDDVIANFIDYAVVATRATDTPPPDDVWWRVTVRLFQRFGRPAPSKRAGDDISPFLAPIEGSLPLCFKKLAGSRRFVSLLRLTGNSDARHALQRTLSRRPLREPVARDHLS